MRKKGEKLLLLTLFVACVAPWILLLVHSQEEPGISVNQKKEMRISKFFKKYSYRITSNRSNIFEKILGLKKLSAMKNFINRTNVINNHSSTIKNFYKDLVKKITLFSDRSSYNLINRNTTFGNKIMTEVNYRRKNNWNTNFVPYSGQQRKVSNENFRNTANLNLYNTHINQMEPSLKLNYHKRSIADFYCSKSSKKYEKKLNRIVRQVDLSLLKNLQTNNYLHRNSSLNLLESKLKQYIEKDKNFCRNAKLQYLLHQCQSNSNNNGLKDCQREVSPKCAMKILNDSRNIDKDVCELYQVICLFLTKPLKNEPCPCKEKPSCGNHKGCRPVDKKGKRKSHFCRGRSTKAFKTSFPSRPRPCRTSPRSPIRTPRVRWRDEDAPPYAHTPPPESSSTPATEGPFTYNQSDEDDAPLPMSSSTPASEGPFTYDPYDQSDEDDAPLPMSSSTPGTDGPLTYNPYGTDKTDETKEELTTSLPLPPSTPTPSSPTFPPSPTEPNYPTNPSGGDESEGEVKPLPFPPSPPSPPSTPSTSSTIFPPNTSVQNDPTGPTSTDTITNTSFIPSSSSVSSSSPTSSLSSSSITISCTCPCIIISSTCPTSVEPSFCQSNKPLTQCPPIPPSEPKSESCLTTICPIQPSCQLCN